MCVFTEFLEWKGVNTIGRNFVRYHDWIKNSTILLLNTIGLSMQCAKEYVDKNYPSKKVIVNKQRSASA